MKKFFKRHFLLDHSVILVCLLSFGIFLGFLWTKQREHSILYFTLIGLCVVGSVIIIFVLFRLEEVYLVKVIEYCKQTETAIEELEGDFSKVCNVGWRIRVGEQWIFFIDKDSFPNLVLKNDIYAVEFARESSGRGSAKYAYCHLNSGEAVKIPSSKKHEEQLKLLCEFQNRF